MAWEGVSAREKPCMQRAPDAFCVIQHRAEMLRAGVRTQATAQTHSCPTAPSSSSWVQAIKKTPAAAVHLVPAAPAYVSLISIRCSPLLCSKKSSHQHLPMVSVQSFSLFYINNVKQQIP